MAKSAKINVLFGADLTQFSTKMQNAQRKINKMGRNMQKLGKGLTVGVTAPLLGLAVGSLKAAANLETLETSLAVMTGSAEAGAEALKDLTDFTASTPFQLDQVGKAAKQLLAFGFSADEVKEKLQTLGDISAGSGNQIGDVAQIFGQVSAAGKLTGERFNQLAERAIPIGSAIAKTMGIAETSVKEFISKGKVDFATFETAFQSLANEGGLFAGAMEKQSKTLAGLFSTLKDNVTLAFGEIGNSISDAVNLQSVMEKITKSIQSAVAWFKELSPEVKKFIVVIASIAAAIGPLLALAGTVLPAILSGFTILAGPVGLIVAALTAIGVIIYKNWTPIKKTLVDIANYFIDLYNESIIFRYSIDAIVFTFKNLWETVKFIFGAIGSILKTLVTNFVESFKLIGDVIKAALTFDADLIAEAWNKFRETGLATTENLISDLQKDWKGLSNGINDNLKDAIEGGGQRAKIVLKPEQIDTTAISTAVTGAASGRSKGTAVTGNSKGVDDFGLGFTETVGAMKAVDDWDATYSVEQLDNLREAQERLSETAQAVGYEVANAFANMAYNFVDSLGLADDGFQGFVKNLAGTVIQLIAQMLAASIAMAIKSGTAAGALLGPAGLFATPAFIATAIGGVVSAFAAIPKFAEGGIVSGPTLAMVGEYTGASSNPEVIAPLDKLRSMIGVNGAQEVTVNGSFEVDGHKLRVVLDRSDKMYNRLG